MQERVRVAYTVMQCWHRVPGGTATSVLSLARELRRHPEIDLIGVGPWFGGVPAAPWTPPMPWRRVPAPYQLAYDIWHYTPLLKPSWVIRDLDVVHATTVTVPPKGPAALVVTIHDLFPLSSPEQFTKRGVRIMSKGIEQAREHADIVCCPSRHTMDDCIAAGFDADRLRVVPWGSSPTAVGPDDRRRVHDRYRLNRPYLLWVGTIEPRKNLPTLLDAFTRMQPTDHDLVLAGPIGWHEQLEGHIEHANNRIRRLGFVPHDDLAALYAEADVFCFPSRQEGFGLPALEAMAQSTPVVAAADTAVAEVVDGGGVTVAADDVDGWADALSKLIADGGRREALGAAALTRSQDFSWERCAQEMSDIYRDVSK